MGHGGEEAAKIARRECDAAFRRGVTGSGEVEEDGAAAIARTRANVPIEDADDVVEVVLAPHALMRCGGWQTDRAVVAAVGGGVAPTVAGSDGMERKTRQRR